MDYAAIVERLLKLEDEPGTQDVAQFIGATAERVAAEICADKCKIVDLVKGLNAVLTSTGYEIRSRGVDLLARVIKALPTSLLAEKEIEVMTEFISLRLIDHKSMERAALECLSHLADCANKPARYNKQLMEFIKSKANFHKMDARSRRGIYELLKKFVAERRRQSSIMDGEFIYSLVALFEGESHPDNILLCFGMISFILKNFADLDPYIEDIFEWLSSYYPIDYTPSDDKSGDISIQRLDLTEALYECFYASPLNAENLQALLLEKLDSNRLSTKLESLECLIKCYENQAFPIANIIKYNSTLWTALRMSCLRKLETIDANLLETCLRTLTSLAERLCKDSNDVFREFIDDMYEELAIAFRKPEMGLFEPAARLLAHALLPVGEQHLNQVLDKLLSTTLTALSSDDELRPLSGVVYLLEVFNARRPEIKFAHTAHITRLACLATDLLIESQNELAGRLLVALFRQRAHLAASSGDTNSPLDVIIEKLETKLRDDLSGASATAGAGAAAGYLDAIEKCLALICANYNKFHIVTSVQMEEFDLSSLIRVVLHYHHQGNDRPLDGPRSAAELAQILVYLRLFTMELSASTRAQLDALDQAAVAHCLANMRTLVELLCKGTASAATAASAAALGRICESSARIHAIILNKLTPSNATEIVMSLFGSKYCQQLLPSPNEIPEGAQTPTELSNERSWPLNIYLPHVKWMLKALVIGNHPLAEPLVNLILNCITSDWVAPELAREASLVFSFVCLSPSDDAGSGGGDDDMRKLFSAQSNFQIFSLFKQKFYMQTSREVKLRLERLAPGPAASNSRDRRGLLVYALASQLAHLPLAVYKRDHEWLVRQILLILAPSGDGGEISAPAKDTPEEGPSSALFQALYSCLEGLIQADLCAGLVPFLPSLIDLNLGNARAARSLVIRRQALLCLARIAATFKESDLLVYRASVADRLRACLADKKRLVRQAAGETRLRWLTIGQPIGTP